MGHPPLSVLNKSTDCFDKAGDEFYSCELVQLRMLTTNRATSLVSSLQLH